MKQKRRFFNPFPPAFTLVDEWLLEGTTEPVSDVLPTLAPHMREFLSERREERKVLEVE